MTDAPLPVLTDGAHPGLASVRRPMWDGAITFTSHGTTVAVRSTDAAVLKKISMCLPTGAQLCDATTADAIYSWTVEQSGSALPVHVVTMRCRRYLKPKRIARTIDIDKALTLLNHDAEFRIAMYAPDDVFIHAAAVSWHGQAVLIPGHSFAGKTTLAAELVRQGAPYYSDEYTVLDTEGRVLPFARHLTLRCECGHPATRLGPEELGGRKETAALPVGGVIVTRYVRGTHWKPHPMTRGQIALALLGHAIDVQARPRHALERIVRCLGVDVVGLKGDRGEMRPTARDILSRFQSR